MRLFDRVLLALIRLPPPPQETVIPAIFELSEAIDKAQYKIYIGAAKILWGIDSAILSLIHLINQWRNALASDGFTNALDVVANNTVGLSRPVFQLALTTFLILCIATPIIRARWVNIRTAVVLAVALPLLLPFLAASFQDIDRARTNLGATLYNDIFASSHFDMGGGGGGGTGMDRDMCELRSFTPIDDGYRTYRGVDVGAAYLCATYDDVMNPVSALPTEFTRRYFELTPSQFEEQDEAIRDRELEEAEFGLKRLAFGIILLVFALIETCISLSFTITLGALFIALFLALLLSFFSLFESFLQGVTQKIAALFLESWLISSVQALLLAALLSVAESGVATRVLGMGVLGVLLEGFFLTMAFKSLLGAITGAVGHGGSGGVSAFEAGRMLNPIRSAAGGAADAVMGGVMAAPTAAMAYGAARRQGASTAFSAGYALNTSRPLAAMGSLATAMGLGGSEFAAGGAQAQMSRHRGQGVLSAMGLSGVSQHVGRQAEQTQREQRYQSSQQERQADKAVREERYQTSEARRQESDAQRAGDRAYQMQERQRREQERQAREARTAQEAPIQAITREAIADAVVDAYATDRGGGATTTPVSQVSDRLGLDLGPRAFGRAEPSVRKALERLHTDRVPPNLAQQAAVEAVTNQQFQPATRTALDQHYLHSGTYDPAARQQRIDRLEETFQKLPTSIRIEDALDPAPPRIAPPAAVPDPPKETP